MHLVSTRALQDVAGSNLEQVLVRPSSLRPLPAHSCWQAFISAPPLPF